MATYGPWLPTEWHRQNISVILESSMGYWQPDFGGKSAETFSSGLTCTVWWPVIDAWPDVTGPLPMSGLCVCQRPSRVLTFSSKEEVGRIWKMELLKESDGLGIQVSGGRGSKRSPHAIVVTQVKEGGAAHRWLVTLPHPSVSFLPLPPFLWCWVPFAWPKLW